MLTDLHLQKYLHGLLSDKEDKEVEAMLEKNPSMKKRLEELEERSEVTRPRWERSQLERKSKRGSKVRYTIILPALLILLLIVALSSHWFSKPGANSTFMRTGGNSTAVELLYKSVQGWRYLDAEFGYGDSMTFAVRDGNKYTLRIFGIYPSLPEAVAEEIWRTPSGQRYGSGDAKPIFSSRPLNEPAEPRYLAVVYDTGSVESITPEDLPGLLREGGGGGRIPAFRYQVFRIPETTR